MTEIGCGGGLLAFFVGWDRRVFVCGGRGNGGGGLQIRQIRWMGF